ncbi:MAG: cytochrome P450 [bacterium]|nr:cytochrome P450 [bacterium]
MTFVLDAYDPEFLRDPYPAFDRIREETPVFRGPGRAGERPIWFLTRHDDVRRALRDRRLGRIDQPTVDREAWGLPPLRDGLEPYYDVEHWALVWLEPPNHTKIRRLVSTAFTMRRLAGLRPRIGELADRLLDPVVERGRFDLVNDYAAPLSVQVIAELLGAPTEDWCRMLDWSSRITRMYEYNITDADTRAAVTASVEFAEYCRELMDRRRARPRDDMITALCFARTEDGTLTDTQIVSMIITLLNAGHEASVNTLANGMLALMQHPDQWGLLTGGEVDPATAAEELFRWDAPIQTFDRWVVADSYEVGGQTIGQYEQVTVLLGCANRDPRHFDDPNSFRIGRGDPTHVSFGGGIHHCLGAPLARLEVDVALHRLATRCPELELVEQPVRPPRFVLRGFNSLRFALARP